MEELFIYDGVKNPRKRKAVRIVCDNCGDTFLKAKRAVKDNNYCSVECRAKSRKKRVKVKCSYCGNTIERTPSKSTSSTGYIFCNRDCQSKSQAIDSGIGYTSNYKDGSSSTWNWYSHRG